LKKSVIVFSFSASSNLNSFFHNFLHILVNILRTTECWTSIFSRVSGHFSKNLISNYLVYHLNALFLFELPLEFQGTERLLRITECFELLEVWIIDSSYSKRFEYLPETSIYAIMMSWPMYIWKIFQVKYLDQI